MSSTTKLLPCPFCSNADISIKNESPKDNSGGYFIECPGCGASTSLRFACGDDPSHLLAEQWNRRTASHCLHQIAEPQTAPAAVAVPELQDMLRELRVQISAITAQLHPSVDCSGVWMAHDKMSAALAATPAAPAAAAPVVLPEPDAYNHGAMIVWSRKKGVPQIDGDLYTARTVRALLATATGLPAQAVRVANCYSDDEGDTWRDCPDDCEFVEGRALGEEFELQASIRSWAEVFRITKVPDETSDDYEVEPVSIRTTTAPQAQADARDAARWREVLVHVGAGRTRGYGGLSVEYVLRTPLTPPNVMQGSVAQHFTKSIDECIDRAAIAAAKGEQQ